MFFSQIKRKADSFLLKRKGIYFNPRTFRESQVVYSQSAPLLLIGLPRSGTSIAQILLNKIDGLFMSYESIMEPFLFENDSLKLSAFYYESLRQTEHIQKLQDGKSVSIKPPLYQANYTYLGNKSIYSMSKEYKKALDLTISKGTKVILLTRESADRISSVLKWHKKRDELYKNTQEKRGEFEQFVQQEHGKSNDFAQTVARYKSKANVFCLSYESLVSDIATFESMCQFLGLDDVDDALDFYKKNVFSASIGAQKSAYPVIDEILKRLD